MMDYGRITEFIEPRIVEFHKKRAANLLELQLSRILKRKNPYLFKAKNILKAADLVQSLMDAHLSSQEEGIFGGFLEELALFVCTMSYNGTKSSAEGIDLEFEKDAVRYIVSIKSGPNWGNSGQVKKMKDNFRKAKRILRTNVSATNVVSINGCCYGKDDSPDKGEYLKLCGQRFWEFISGDQDLYLNIIEPVGHEAKRNNEFFVKEYAKVLNKFTREFSESFCEESGEIDWEKLVKFNSAKKPSAGSKGA